MIRLHKDHADFISDVVRLSAMDYDELRFATYGLTRGPKVDQALSAMEDRAEAGAKATVFVGMPSFASCDGSPSVGNVDLLRIDFEDKDRVKAEAKRMGVALLFIPASKLWWSPTHPSVPTQMRKYRCSVVDKAVCCDACRANYDRRVRAISKAISDFPHIDWETGVGMHTKAYIAKRGDVCTGFTGGRNLVEFSSWQDLSFIVENEDAALIWGKLSYQLFNPIGPWSKAEAVPVRRAFAPRISWPEDDYVDF